MATISLETKERKIVTIMGIDDGLKKSIVGRLQSSLRVPDDDAQNKKTSLKVCSMVILGSGKRRW
jgi:hypothetical protein